MPGGRPRNDWRVSRERKLARLYMLSNLNLDDIQKVLKVDGFNPSLSDIQKRLRALLPKDYATDYRKYRPSSRDNAKLRLSQIKYCTDGRVRKRPRSYPPGRDNNTKHDAAGPQTIVFTRPANTLRNCYTVPASVPGLHLLSEWLQHPSINDTMRSCPSALERNSTQPARSVEILNDITTLEAVSNTTASRRDSYQVSLDTLNVDWPMSDIPKLRHGQYATDVDFNGISEQPVGGMPTSLADLNSQITAGQSLAMQTITSDTTSQEEEISSGALSIRSLRRRLRDRHSESSLEHIQSVLRYSLTNSWRSSLISVISSAKSRLSVASWTQQTQAVPESAGSEIAPGVPASFLHEIKTRLTGGEQKVWDDLVDETQLDLGDETQRTPPLAALPSYPEISLLARPCCNMAGDSVCKTCGFSEAHRRAIRWAKMASIPAVFYAQDPNRYVGVKDRFGNTPLHFAAANGRSGILHVVKWLVEGGTNLGAKNTSGETFIHVAHPDQFNALSEYIELLQLLAKCNFPLLHRDYHGQSPADVFFMAVNPTKLSYEHLTIIVSHLQPCAYDLSCLANNSEWRNPQSKKQLDALLAQCRKPIHSFNGFLLSNPNMLAKLSDAAHLVRELDSNGDSALIHVIKEWQKKSDERKLRSVIQGLVKLGAEVNMRDRNGDTALAIAARRGLRPAVLKLVWLGANPNTRCYRGNGVHFQTTKYLMRAKKDGRAKQYAMILSCLSLLSHCGTKVNPTVYDEWWAHAIYGGLIGGERVVIKNLTESGFLYPQPRPVVFADSIQQHL